MFEGVSEIAGRVSQLQQALDSFNQQPPPSAGNDGSSFQQTLAQAQSPADQSDLATPPSAGGEYLRPSAFSPSQLANQTFSTGTSGATQLPASASSLGNLSLDGLGSLGASSAGLTGGASGGLAGLLGGASSGADGGLGLLSGLDTSGGLGGMLGSSTSPDASGALSSLLGGSGEAYGSQAGSIADALSAGGVGAQPNTMAGLVGQIAQSQGVNPALAEAVAQSESGFNPQAVSPAGAQGLMQLMPGTFQQYAGTPGVPSGVPVSGASVSQPFGPTSFSSEPPLEWNGTKYAHFHTGIDLAVPQGTPIRATMAGTVQVRSDPQGFGNLLVITNGPWDILYGHTSGHPSNIQTGSVVKPGDVIGYTGSTGNSSGPHVHYEVHYNGQILDPTPFLGGTEKPNPMDPVANAQAGVSYLKSMLSKFHNNVPAALAAYNAGPAAVQKYGGVPPYPETQNYVQKTLQNAQNLTA